MSSLRSIMAQQTEEDKTTSIPLSGLADSKSLPKPRWQQRQLDRQQYLCSSLAMRMAASKAPSLISPSPSSLSQSPSPHPHDQAHDALAGHQRQSDLISTSLHYGSEGAEIRNRVSKFTSTSSTPHFSHHTKSSSLPSDLFSQASTSNFCSSRTSASWFTCADRDIASALPGDLHYWPVKMLPQNDGDDEEPKKVKVFDMVLSAFDRKKKRNLPNTNNPFEATQAPSTESLFLHRPACVYEPRKLKPRGAAERQDFSALRSFLDANPARPEDRAKTTYEPKSDFDWEDTDDEEEEDSKVSDFPRKYFWQHKQSMKDKGDDGGESRGIESAEKIGEEGSMGRVMSEAGEDDDEVNLEAGKEAEFMRGRSAATYSFGATSASTQATHEQDAAESPNVMEMYEDPIWNGGYQLREEGEDDNASQRQSLVRTAASLGSSSTRSSSVRGRTKLALRTETKGASFVECPEHAKSPTPRKSVDKDLHGQDVSTQAATKRKPEASPLPQISTVSPMPKMSSSISFASSSKGSSETAESPSVARQTWEFEASNASRTSISHRPRKQNSSAAGSPATEHANIPKFFARAKRAMSNKDISIAAGNAFAQEKARKVASPTPEDAIYTGDKDKKGQNVTLCYSTTPPPSRFVRVAEKLKILPPGPQSEKRMISPSLSSAPQSEQVMVSPSLSSAPQSLYAGSPASASSSFTKPSPRGLPAGPWEPDWDDAVKWARKELNKHAEREAKEARDLKREMKQEEKRLKKLNAGKDAVKRQSLLGMVPKKPLEDITEDEFELVGEAAMVADNSTPTTKSNLLGALFTKMQGSKQERKKRANEIGHSLDNHASLHMLSKTHSNTADEPNAENDERYNETLRMLEGETPVPKELVNPFERSADDTTIGLGISSPEEEEELAKHNRLAAKMSYEDFAAMKAKEEELRKVQPGHCREPPSPRPRASQEATTIRPMTTIKELDRETNTSPSSDKTIRAGHNRNISPSIYSTDDVVEWEDPSGQETQIKQDIRNFRSGQYRYYEDDAISVNTIESDAIPPPLNVPKPRAKPFSPKNSKGNEIGSRPRRVPILHVSKSSQHLQPTESKSFIPRRNSEFRIKIREQSRVQASKVGNHPALRVQSDTPSKAGKVRSHPALHLVTDETGIASTYSDDRDYDRRPETMAMPARVDSGIGTSAVEVADEGYGTGNVSQQEYARSEGSPMIAGAADAKTQPRQRKATLMAPDDAGAQQATGVDLSALRRQVGLDPAQLSVGPQVSKHPNHPFTWHHEKVMCYGVHNPINMQPPLPAIPENQPVDMSRVSSKNFSTSPTKGKIPGVKTCASCSTPCCRFAHLALLSKKATNKDVAEENMRIKAEQRVEKLRAYHPNGIEEYDTFLTCLRCERKVCPECSTKCFERLCVAIVCTDCTPASGVCPVHNEKE